MKLIDAEKLIRSLSSVCVTDDSIGMGIKMGLNHAIQTINDIPSVDAVEVVRCKDCIHWYETEGVCLKIYSDGAVSPYAWQDRNPDDFCSYGERRTDEH